MFKFGKTKKLEEQVASLQSELTTVKNETHRLSEAFPGTELFEILTAGAVSAAGAVVNERTAMNVGVVYACVSLIAGAIASLPLPIYKRTENGRERYKHPLWWLLNEQPTPIMSAAVFWEFVVTSLLLSGDAFIYIVRNQGGEAIELIPINPRFVEVVKKDGRLNYYFYPPDMEAFGADQDDVLHIPGIGFDGLRGMSPIRHAACQAIGIALAAEEYSGRFFSNGARPDFALVTGEKKLSDEQVRVLRETWARRHGGAANAHLPAVLTGGMDVKQLTMSAEDAQLLSTRQFQVVDICRIYGVPPHMVGETEKTSSWGSGVEQMSIGFVKYTLQRHLTKIEEEINRKIFRIDRYFCEFNVDGLLRGDSKSRAEYYRAALGGSGGPGWMTQNEVRQLDNLPPINDGDKLTDWSQKNGPKPA